MHFTHCHSTRKEGDIPLDNRPIGVFDSGLGGLTAVKELRRIMPDEQIIYLGDTARAPYGTRSDKNIQRYAVQDTGFLLEKDVKAILIACGTVSSTSMQQVRECAGDIPVMGVIDASAMKAAGITENRRVAILATSATIRSRSYVKKLLETDPDIDYIEKGCPLLVSLVENGYVDKDNIALNEIIKDYLATVIPFDADTYILGCTHFPIIKDAIKKHIGDAEVIESGKEAADMLKSYLAEHDMCCEAGASGGSVSVYVTERTGNFNKVADIFMGDVRIDRVEEISLER